MLHSWDLLHPSFVAMRGNSSLLLLSLPLMATERGISSSFSLKSTDWGKAPHSSSCPRKRVSSPLPPQVHGWGKAPPHSSNSRSSPSPSTSTMTHYQGALGGAAWGRRQGCQTLLPPEIQQDSTLIITSRNTCVTSEEMRQRNKIVISGEIPLWY